MKRWSCTQNVLETSLFVSQVKIYIISVYSNVLYFVCIYFTSIKYDFIYTICGMHVCTRFLTHVCCYIVHTCVATKINIEWKLACTRTSAHTVRVCMCVYHKCTLYVWYVPFISFMPNCGDRTSVYGLFNTQFPIQTTVQNLDIHFTHSMRTF